MKPIVSSEVTKARIARWIERAQSATAEPVWTETRQAIEFGGHLYLVSRGQVFQCAHCGHYDPEWDATEVLGFFEENFGIKPIEIQVTCSVAVSSNE